MAFYNVKIFQDFWVNYEGISVDRVRQGIVYCYREELNRYVLEFVLKKYFTETATKTL